MEMPQTNPQNLIPSPYKVSHSGDALLSFKSQRFAFPLPSP